MMRELFQIFQVDRLKWFGAQIDRTEIERSLQPRLHWAELDILRGIAAVSMIVNHLGYKILHPAELSDGLTSNLVFIGSFAPVLFFFVTGVGYGIQSIKPQKANHWAILLNKVMILIIADQFFYWSSGRWIGLDFLGFIGFSCVVLEFIRSSRHPVLYSWAGLIIISSLRYGIGPHLKVSESLGYGREFANWLLGTSSVDGISYPLSPWMGYPLLGYLVGYMAAHYPDLLKQRWLRLSLYLSFLAILPLTTGMILAHKGSPFFRWGTVSLSYYIASFATIMLALVGAILIFQVRPLKMIEKHLSLPGIASFAIVPIHYFLIYLLEVIKLEKLSSLSFYGVAIVTLLLSFLIAKLVNQVGKYSQGIRHQRLVYWSFVGIVVLSATLVFGCNQENIGLTMLARTLGQTMLCLLFALRRA